MSRIVECVPNFSEGRDRELVEALVAAASTVPGVVLLDSEMDADHHRSVVTFAGEPEACVEAAFRAIRLATERIDLNGHRGQHPRMGATDVVPFVPVDGVTLEDCVALARTLGKRVGEELKVPVFLYEAAATRPERENLADVRRGEFEGLRELVGKDPARVPDFGPNAVHPTAGAVAIGARRPLVAFNANLATADVAVAKRIAKAIRFGDGGLRYVKALGFSIRDGRQAQVSMNLVNTDGTPIHRVLALIDDEAKRWGTYVTGCEVVGLVPQAAMLDAAEHHLRLENFRRDQVLEIRMQHPPVGEGVSLGGFLDEVASGSPTPGGGTAAALGGALAASLVTMVCNLTLGKKKHASVQEEVKAIKDDSEAWRRRLTGLMRRDSQAFDRVLAAFRLPQGTPAEAENREKAIEDATWEATRVPLETAETATQVARLAARIVRIGNPNAASDGATAAALARAACESALCNVEINLKNLPAGADKDAVAARVGELARHAEEALVEARKAFAEATERTA
ncbi:MAG: glutamate formimidoyltransferase [Candidatus Eiseniibacteriota bacterium]